MGSDYDRIGAILQFQYFFISYNLDVETLFNDQVYTLKYRMPLKLCFQEILLKQQSAAAPKFFSLRLQYEQILLHYYDILVLYPQRMHTALLGKPQGVCGWLGIKMIENFVCVWLQETSSTTIRVEQDGIIFQQEHKIPYTEFS